uniref:Uncharacterized protein n=1 Tax=Glossina austeni TaxID=7395 RepID=A0A1A9UZW5_GLOAU
MVRFFNLSEFIYEFSVTLSKSPLLLMCYWPTITYKAMKVRKSKNKVSPFVFVTTVVNKPESPNAPNAKCTLQEQKNSEQTANLETHSQRDKGQYDTYINIVT